MKYKSFPMLVALLAFVILAGCQEQQKAPQFAGVNVQSYTVKQQPVSNTERFYGEITSKESITLSSTIPGRVQKAPQINGEEVKKGQTLFIIENKDLQSAVRQAQSSVGLSQANLEKIKAGPTEHEVLAMEENVQAAKAGYEMANQNAERLKKLFDQGAISQQQLEQAQTDEEVARSRYHSLQNQLDHMKAGPAQETIQVGESQLQQAQVSYQSASSKLEELTIESPLTGFIADLQAQTGEFVSPGMPLATIHHIEQVYIQLNIPESTYLGLKRGSVVEVNIPSVNRAYRGRISELYPHADPKTKLFRVKILIKNEKGWLKPGMAAEVGIPVADKQEAIIVPLDAVINDKGQSMVFVIEGETARKRTIQTGIRTAADIEVVSGLRIGEKIIRDGVEFVRDGDLVKVLKEGNE